MPNIIPFSFENHSVRSLIIDDQPWFVAADICHALGYENSRDAIYKHVDQEDKNTVAIRDSIASGNPNKQIINESGLYSLILRSRKPEAKRFKRWVTSEVLPAIRKTGGYSLIAPPLYDTSMQALRMAPSAVIAAKAFGFDQNMAALSANRFIKTQTQVDLLDLFGQKHLVAENQQAMFFTPTQLGKRWGISGKAFNQKLADAGLQIKRDGVWVPTGVAEGFYRLYDTAKRHSNGTPITQIKWMETVLDMLPVQEGGNA